MMTYLPALCSVIAIAIGVSFAAPAACIGGVAFALAGLVGGD